MPISNIPIRFALAVMIDSCLTVQLMNGFKNSVASKCSATLHWQHGRQFPFHHTKPKCMPACS